jgi:hypothetical protein
MTTKSDALGEIIKAALAARQNTATVEIVSFMRKQGLKPTFKNIKPYAVTLIKMLVTAGYDDARIRSIWQVNEWGRNDFMQVTFSVNEPPVQEYVPPRGCEAKWRRLQQYTNQVAAHPTANNLLH